MSNINFHTCLQTPPRSRGLQAHLHIPRFFESLRLQRGNSLVCTHPNFSNLRVGYVSNVDFKTCIQTPLRSRGLQPHLHIPRFFESPRLQRGNSLVCTHPDFSNLRVGYVSNVDFKTCIQTPPRSRGLQPHLHIPRFFESPSWLRLQC